ncbi:MAG: HAMP domain-containing histidine kinase [Chloroflexi bacterium]|nr:HAMP domain-containing histidine kinase [Chloroflexota bacterium]MCC6891723.1 HAMP domain-containing histidine kinase [Anaerolineae bacterium]
MSRINVFGLRFLLKARALNTFVETALLFLVLLLFVRMVYQAIAADMTFTALLFFINPCAALYYSLRLRIPQGRWYRQFAVDLLYLLMPTLVFNVLVWLPLRVTQTGFTSTSREMTALDLVFIITMAFPYVFFRVMVRFVAWWNELRQRRMIWSLVSSNLVAVAVLQLIVIIPISFAIFFSNFTNNPLIDLPDTPMAQMLFRLQTSLPMVGLAILMATAILIALLPVSIAVSYFFARRIRQRLDDLLKATHAARDGQYDTQVAVSGRDELARLQADFNVMTQNLKLTIDALRDEREKVSTLLKVRRELMANVSHELRTPIATVRAYLDSMQREQDADGRAVVVANDLVIIEHETLRLQKLVDDLFALSRAEIDQLTIQPVPLDCTAVIQQVIETVTPIAWRSNRVEVVSKLPTWLPKVLADEARLEQVLRNLIHNSLKHTPPGGLVIIHADEHSGFVKIEVQDTGEGILPEHLPHIWERYYRDTETGGTGLGLALVKSFVESMAGEVSVRSTPGEGACFTIMLPAYQSLLDVRSDLPKPEPVARSAAKSPAAPR